MNTTYTVWQLTATIRDLLDQDPRLHDIWVEGEVSRPTRASSGHFYFTLKDDRSELSGVMWSDQYQRLHFEPKHGDAVLAHGTIGVFERQGKYQLYCDTLQPAGIGELNRQYEMLKAALGAEGLFDAERKRPVPAFPQVIGVVTSPTTAAFQDILTVLRRRCPLVHLILSPTPVQGREAPPQIVAAIQRLNDFTQADVILLARGGGSMEDLWCFNDEAVVRAVAASRIPVVTGVGHEIDTTLVDFAADLRAPTPSAAAELLTPDSAALRGSIRLWADQLESALAARLDERRQQVEGQRRWLERLSPRRRIQDARQQIDHLMGQADIRLRHDLARRRDRLAGQERALRAANPLILLERGYALVTRAGDGKRVTSARDAAEGTLLLIRLHDGQLAASVRERKMNE